MNDKKDIFEAISNGTIEDVRYFIEKKKVGFNIKSDQEATPLYTAAVFNKTEVVKYLITAGANVNEKDGGGGTPLHEAVGHGNIELVKWLVSKGADLNAKAMDGKVAVLDMAKSEEMIQYLKSIGAKSAKDSSFSNLFNSISKGADGKQVSEPYGDTSTKESSDDLLWEKRRKRILLRCSLICFIIAPIIGVIISMSSGGDIEEVFVAIIVGMWVGVGLGNAISLLTNIPGLFTNTLKEEGFFAAIKIVFITGIIGFLLCWLTGPIGLLVRVIKINLKIKKLQNN